MTAHLPGLPVETRRLDNGLRVVVNPDPANPLAAVRLAYHVGSRDDPPERGGCAHLAEHLALQGTTGMSRSETMQTFRRLGGEMSAMTWFDWTSFAGIVPAPRLDEALRVELHRTTGLLPSLDPAKLDAERRVVLAERKQKVDQRPYGAAYETLRGSTFEEGHPYRRSILGRPESIRRIQLDDVVELVGARYRPDNAVLVVSGGIDAAETMDEVADRFGTVGPTGSKRVGTGDAPPTVPLAVVPSRTTMRDRVSAAAVYLMFRGPSVGDPGFAEAEVLAAVLAGGANARLDRALVCEREMAWTVDATAVPTELTGIFYVSARGRRGVAPGDLERALWSALDDVGQHGPGPDSLRAARNRLRRRRVGRLSRLKTRSFLLARDTLLRGAPRGVNRWTRRLAAVDAHSVRLLARSTFRRDTAGVLHVLPRREDAEGRAPARAAPSA